MRQWFVSSHICARLIVVFSRFVRPSQSIYAGAELCPGLFTLRMLGWLSAVELEHQCIREADDQQRKDDRVPNNYDHPAVRCDRCSFVAQTLTATEHTGAKAEQGSADKQRYRDGPYEHAVKAEVADHIEALRH